MLIINEFLDDLKEKLFILLLFYLNNMHFLTGTVSLVLAYLETDISPFMSIGPRGSNKFSDRLAQSTNKTTFSLDTPK